MNILFLSYFFEPDLSAGSFRNTALFEQLLSKINTNDHIYIFTTEPNRYKSYKSNAFTYEKGINYTIIRIKVPSHKNGFIDQIKSFYTYYRNVVKCISELNFDLVYGSSSRLFTAYLASKIGRQRKIPIFLDIRDIFYDTLIDVLGKKSFILFPITFIIKKIESSTFKNATHINLVSEGFKNYFKQYNKPNYSFYSNGIDGEFIRYNYTKSVTDKIVITYAGNIGSGQGLEKIIPEAARKLGNNYKFVIIGDGGTKDILYEKIKHYNLNNVEIISPIKRSQLLDYYNRSSFLFLHLNNLKAFEKVLPSKLFEYGATNKPILAGVSGYAAEFVKMNLDNTILFSPTDVDELVNKISNYNIIYKTRTEFIGKFERSKIMNEMSDLLLNYIKKS